MASVMWVLGVYHAGPASAAPHLLCELMPPTVQQQPTRPSKQGKMTLHGARMSSQPCCKKLRRPPSSLDRQVLAGMQSACLAVRKLVRQNGTKAAPLDGYQLTLQGWSKPSNNMHAGRYRQLRPWQSWGRSTWSACSVASRTRRKSRCESSSTNWEQHSSRYIGSPATLSTCFL